VPPLKTSYRPWKPWKMPRGREYAPRPLDPGQPVEWDADGVTRTGVIWDRADRPNSFWAQPGEDPAHPVYLSRYGKDGPFHEVPGVADKARANIVSGNLVRQRGIYAVIHRTGDHAAACWHTDPDCPRAAGLERYDPRIHGRIPDSTAEYGNTWTALDIARELTADFQRKPKNLPVCPDCVTGLDIPPQRTGPAAPRPEPETRPEGNPDQPAAPEPGPEPEPDSGQTGTLDEPAGTAFADGPPAPVTAPGHPDSEEEPPAAPPPEPAAGRCRRPARFALRLEPPATDEEFLGSCAAIGAALAALGGQVGAWADGLRVLHFPASVLGPLDKAAAAIAAAGTGAAQAAAAFDDEFGDARDVAARGMHITGQDAP
jgi:hypothetical protein